MFLTVCFKILRARHFVYVLQKTMAAFDVERSKFAICRLSKVELSDGTPRYRTLGSGSVVRSEELRQKLKSDRAVFLITTSEVITESLLNVKQRRPTYKIIAEFQKKSASNKFETLEINAQLLSSTKQQRSKHVDCTRCSVYRSNKARQVVSL